MLRPDRVRALRAEAGLTLLALSEKTGIHDRTISRYEAGPVDAESSALVALANSFGVSVDYLLGLSDMPHPENGLPENERALLAARWLGVESKPACRVCYLCLLLSSIYIYPFHDCESQLLS